MTVTRVPPIALPAAFLTVPSILEKAMTVTVVVVVSVIPLLSVTVSDTV